MAHFFIVKKSLLPLLVKFSLFVKKLSKVNEMYAVKSIATDNNILTAARYML